MHHQILETAPAAGVPVVMGSKSWFGLGRPQWGHPKACLTPGTGDFQRPGKAKLLSCPGRAGLQDAAMGREPQHQVGPPHPGTLVCSPNCVIKTVLLKQMGTLSIQTQEIANTLRLHVLSQPGASVWFFYSNRSSTYENFDVVENQKSRCFSLF